MTKYVYLDGKRLMRDLRRLTGPLLLARMLSSVVVGLSIGVLFGGPWIEPAGLLFWSNFNGAVFLIVAVLQAWLLFRTEGRLVEMVRASEVELKQPGLVQTEPH